MKLLIKILGQTKQYPALHVDYGTGYTFPWSEPHKAYVYAPRSQKEIDDIFASQTVHSVWFFAPILVDEKSEAAPAAAEAPKASKEAEGEIARLTGLLRAAEAAIQKKNAQAKDDATTIELLRADLKAQQEKAVAKKPGRRVGPAPTDSTAPELAPE